MVSNLPEEEGLRLSGRKGEPFLPAHRRPEVVQGETAGVDLPQRRDDLPDHSPDERSAPNVDAPASFHPSESDRPHVPPDWEAGGEVAPERAHIDGPSKDGRGSADLARSPVRFRFDVTILPLDGVADPKLRAHLRGRGKEEIRRDPVERAKERRSREGAFEHEGIGPGAHPAVGPARDVDPGPGPLREVEPP